MLNYQMVSRFCQYFREGNHPSDSIVALQVLVNIRMRYTWTWPILPCPDCRIGLVQIPDPTSCPARINVQGHHVVALILINHANDEKQHAEFPPFPPHLSSMKTIGKCRLRHGRLVFAPHQAFHCFLVPRLSPIWP